MVMSLLVLRVLYLLFQSSDAGRLEESGDSAAETFAEIGTS
jgi:hypothetical protein